MPIGALLPATTHAITHLSQQNPQMNQVIPPILLNPDFNVVGGSDQQQPRPHLPPHPIQQLKEHLGRFHHPNTGIPQDSLQLTSQPPESVGHSSPSTQSTESKDKLAITNIPTQQKVVSPDSKPDSQMVEQTPFQLSPTSGGGKRAEQTQQERDLTPDDIRRALLNEPPSWVKDATIARQQEQ